MSVNNVNLGNTNQFFTTGFWEIDAYKANVQRIRFGSNQLDEIIKLIKERIDLENRYGKSLEILNQKWTTYSEQQMLPSTIKTSFDNIMLESKMLSKVHLAVKDRLNDEVVTTIGRFKKENYHRSAIRGFKEPKEIEEEFEKAQRQWKKLCKRLDSVKKHYHNCKRVEKSTYIQVVNSHADSSLIQEGTDKARDRYEKCKDETRKARNIYEQQLREIFHYNNVYVENMAFVFEKCQQMEYKRTKFVIEMLSGVQKVLVDLVSPQKLIQLHNNLENHFSSTNDTQINQDLKQWSLLYGKDVVPKWPVFEEYTPELHNISTKSNNNKCTGVILTKKIMKSDIDERIIDDKFDSLNDNKKRFFSSFSQSTQDVYRAENNKNKLIFKNSDKNFIDIKHRRVSSLESVHGNVKKNSTTHPVVANNLSKNNETFLSAKSSFLDQNYLQAKENVNNPFIDPFPMPTPLRDYKRSTSNEYKTSKTSTLTTDLPNIAFTDTDNSKENKKVTKLNEKKLSLSSSSIESTDATKENVLPESKNILTEYKVNQVQVLYDYDPMEDDELMLVKGEIIDVLRPADDLGWCYGRKNNKIGFFPAGYVTNT